MLYLCEPEYGPAVRSKVRGSEDAVRGDGRLGCIHQSFRGSKSEMLR